MVDTKDAPRQADIIIVDDVPENLHVLAGMLKSQNYKVRPFPSGKLAIRAAEAEAPDLILLDIMMPEMDGYEVCRRLKQVEDLKDVPIIFISALTETKDIVKAFSTGGVDYVTKPFEFEEVRARVDTHLKIRSLQIELEKKHRQLEENYEQLRRLEARERELLEKTLSGSIKVLTQILSIAKPAAFGKSARIARLMRGLAVELGIPTWEFELAGRLSQIGCVILPDQLVNKIARGEALVNVEKAVFFKHPEVARELLINIPHLEKIAEIVAQQLEQPPEEGERPAVKVKPAADAVVSARALQMVLECDRLTSAGKTIRSAIGKIKKDAHWFGTTVVAALENVLKSEMLNEVVSVDLAGLREDMILAENIMTTQGALVVTKGQELTPMLLNHIKRFAENSPLRQPILVWASRKGGR